MIRRMLWAGAVSAGVAIGGACGGSQARSAIEEERFAELVADRVSARMLARGQAGRDPAFVATGSLPEDPYSAERQRVKLDDGPARGAAEPLVTVVVFSDFECPYCAQVVPTLERLLETFADDLRLVFRHNPMPFHAHAGDAAIVSIEAFRQGGHPAFWAMHDRLFTEPVRLEREALLAHGRALALDIPRLMAALDGAMHRDTIARDQAYARSLGARGTPTAFLNGRELPGAQPYERFETMVEEEIAHARALLEAGVPRAALYRTLLGVPESRSSAGAPEAAPN